MQAKIINWPLYKAYKNKGFTAKLLCEKADVDYDRFCRLLKGQLKKWRSDEKRKLSQVLRVPQKILFREMQRKR